MGRFQAILVTGGMGFIGSAFIRYLLRKPASGVRVTNLDLLTYAADERNLDGFHEHPRYRFIQGDISNQALVEQILEENEIDAIVHFAAETHVDRSIASSRPFLEANVLGTACLLEAARAFPHIHFHHVSTDEVYGSLGDGGFFCEQSPYRPNSPYAASKAASDHLVRSFANTYGIGVTISHCSNNYGRGQHIEKLIPHMIFNALQNKPLPVYGRGSNVRDWLYVEDHVGAIWTILQKGKKGEVYDIGGGCELTNLALLNLLLELLSEQTGTEMQRYLDLVRFVQDRPGHDFRYAIDFAKIRRELGWKPKTSLQGGLRKTIRYYTKKFLSQVFGS